jgi:hypothetical protein
MFVKIQIQYLFNIDGKPWSMQPAITDVEQNVVFRFGLVLRRYNKSFKNATKPFTTHPQQKVFIVVLNAFYKHQKYVVMWMTKTPFDFTVLI